MRYDTIIIGTGPAGIEAAITLKLRKKNILLIGNKELSGKINSHAIDNYLGFPHVEGKSLVESFKNHLNYMNIDILEDKIKNIYPLGDYFVVSGNEDYESTTIILATGMSSKKPFKGEEEFLGRGVSYCATCDAMLYKGKNILVYSSSIDEDSEVRFLSQVVSNLYLIKEYEAKDYSENVHILDKKILSIEELDNKKRVVLNDSKADVDGVFILREFVSAKGLVPGIEMDDIHIKSNKMMETNIDGLFVCGDIAGRPYQYIKAAGEGNVAALSAVSYIDNLRRKQND